MKILITGGAGFIGSTVVRGFAQDGHQITVFDKITYSGFPEHIYGVKNVVLVKGDLAKKRNISDCFKKFDGFDVVIHIAAESSVDKSIKAYKDFINTNVLGTANLFDVCLKYKVSKVINFSTDEQYGDLNKDGDSFTELTPIAPRNIYSASKASQMLLGKAFHLTHGLPVVTVCPSNCYGPRQYPDKLLPRMMHLMENGKSLPVYGTGLNVREWLFVEDLAEALVVLFHKGQFGETYNVGSGNEKTNLEVLKLLASSMGKELDIEFVKDRKGHDFRYSVNFDKMKSLGWSPKTTLEEGLGKTVQWYKNNRLWLDKTYKDAWEK